MLTFLSAFPAYGRRYNTADDLKIDFSQGKDFSCSLQGGPYFSNRDCLKLKESFDGILFKQVNPPLQIFLLLNDELVDQFPNQPRAE